MNQIRRHFAIVGLFGCVLLLAACPNGKPPAPGPDSTDPQLLEVLVRLEAPTPPNPRGEFNITSTDVTRQGIASDLTIRVIATAGDSESRIKSIVPVAELRWRCAFGKGSQTIGTPQTAALNFTPSSAPPSTPVTPFQLNAVANPIAATGCDTSKPGWGPVDIQGFVRVTATNGATPARTATSKTFIFDYADVGIRQ
jgi:hypothetical protein